MAYEPTNWKAGDTVTSAKLNKLEQGVAGAGSGILIVHDVEGTLDKTWQEIHDGGLSVIVQQGSSDNINYDYVTSVYTNADRYLVAGISLNNIYKTYSTNGYPQIIAPN